FILPVALPRQIRFVAKDTLWMQKGLRGHILRWFFDAVGSVPVDRDALSSGKGALQAGLEILRQGSGFAIYPEGTRSKDGLLHPGQRRAGAKATASCGRDSWAPRPATAPPWAVVSEPGGAAPGVAARTSPQESKMAVVVGFIPTDVGFKALDAAREEAELRGG